MSEQTAEQVAADIVATVMGKKKHKLAKVARDQGAALLNDVHAFLGRFVAYPSDHAQIAHVLWIAHTHLMEAWESTPRICFLSPEPGSGKTRSLEVSELLVPNPILAVNVSAAYLFRKCGSEDGLPTILFDEIDCVFGAKAKDHEDVRSVLNSGHRRGATAGRCIVHGRTVLTEEIPSFAPAALAGLGWLPDTILSRSIIVRMRRRAADEQIEPFRRRIHAPQGEALRQRLASWAITVVAEATEARPDMPAGIEDRNADVWESLLAIADIAGSDWPQRAREAAVFLVSVAGEAEASLGLQLLADLQAIFGDADEMATKDIIAALCALDEAPWADIRGKPLDARGLSHRLRQYGIKRKHLRFGDKTLKGYAKADFIDAWRRYSLSPEKRETRETTETNAESLAPNVSHVSHVSHVAETERDGNGRAGPYPRVCQHCGQAETAAAPVQSCFVAGEEYLLHRQCQRDWLNPYADHLPVVAVSKGSLHHCPPLP
jgi:hypothetical protein